MFKVLTTGESKQDSSRGKVKEDFVVPLSHSKQCNMKYGKLEKDNFPVTESKLILYKEQELYREITTRVIEETTETNM